MEKYKPEERYFEYHLRYYFSLLSKRRSLQKDLVDMVTIGKSSDKHIHEIPLELPELNWEIVDEIRYKTYWQLYNVADTLKARWEIFVDRHKEFETDLDLKPIAATPDRFNVAYHLVKDGTKAIEERAREFAQRVVLGKIPYSVYDSSYWGILHPDMIIVGFPSLDTAVDKTKEYLLAYLDKAMEERRTGR
jgi:hypothetical protein